MSDVNIDLPELSTNEIRRFWYYVNKSPGQGPHGECWEWTAGRTSRGYGRFSIRRGDNTRTLRANRLAYFLCSGEWNSLGVLHTCDNPPCANPLHLYSGTAEQNTADAHERLRYKRGEGVATAVLTEEQVIEIRSLYPQMGIAAIARQFGRGETTIRHIVYRENWTHI